MAGFIRRSLVLGALNSFLATEKPINFHRVISRGSNSYSYMYAMFRTESVLINTDKKENQIFLIYKEIQSGAVAKSYMTNSLLIYGEMTFQLLHSEFPYI